MFFYKQFINNIVVCYWVDNKRITNFWAVKFARDIQKLWNKGCENLKFVYLCTPNF